MPVLTLDSGSQALFQPSASGSVTVINLSDTATIYVATTPTVHSTDIPVGPLAAMTFDASQWWYGSALDTTAQVAVGAGVTGYFLPASLANIGGSKVYVQAGAPSGNIPANSIWFNTTDSALETWDGNEWVNEQFDAQKLIQAATILGTQIAAQAITASNVADGTLTTAQLAAAAGILGGQIALATITSANIAADTIVAANIAANTITASQLAAGIVYAGIVDGTTISGAQIVAHGTSGEFLVYSGSPALGNLIASVSASAGTDSHGNAYPAGIMSQQSAGNQVVIAGDIIEFLTSSTPSGLGGTISAFGNGDLLVAGLGAVTGDTPAAFDLLSEHVTGSAPLMVMQDGGPGAATAIVANQPGAALRTPEDWHAVSLPTGMTGTIRVKVLPLYNLAVLDVNVIITSTSTSAANYTTGSLPSSAYYPTGARQYDLTVNQKYTATSNASPRIALPTSGALTFDMPAFASSGLSCIVSGTILYPLD